MINRLANRLLSTASILSSQVAFGPDGVRGSGSRGGYFALEPRVLFDGAAVDTFTDAISDFAISETTHTTDDAPLFAALAEAHGVELQQEVPQVREVVFIDAAVEDRDQLISVIDPQALVVVLDASRDGVEQMAEVLGNMQGVEAIHIFSHGRSGTLDLGSTKLTEASMAGRHAEEMAIIRGALTDQADILIYGCDFGAGSRGESAIVALAAATGADVAASEDLTGAADLGGDWVLEKSDGQIETGSLRLESWGHLLSLNNSGNWTVVGTTATNVTFGVTTTITFAPTAGGSVTGLSGTQTLNPTALPTSFFVNGAEGDPSLGFVYAWDTTPDATTATFKPDAATDDAPMAVTITFSTPVTNPVINIDRLGGNSFLDPNTAIAGLTARLARLGLRAPADGVITQMMPGLREGVWAGPSDLLLHVRGEGISALGLADERDALRLRLGAKAWFVSEDGARARIAGVLEAVELPGAESTALKYLAVRHGGVIATDESSGEEKAVQSVLPVRFQLAETGTAQALRGQVVVEAEARSWTSAFLARVAAVALRESGF